MEKLSTYRGAELADAGQDGAGEFGSSVLAGLNGKPRTLPCRFFYDAAGSELFEQITELDEYYLTRCEQEILESQTDAILGALPNGEFKLVEFGSGSSRKTRLLIEGLLRRQASLNYVPIDISADFLHETAEVLEAGYSGLKVAPIAREYFQAFQLLSMVEGARLFLFLGSNIGNFEPRDAAKFLRCLADQMHIGDRLLIGADLVKEESILQAAYDDSAGITEAFNKNVLARINRELGGTFDLDGFNHVARWNPEAQRMEMYLESRWRQVVTIDTLNAAFEFSAGEMIHTENSHKYTPESLGGIAAEAGLRLNQTWTDSKGWFMVAMLEKTP